MPGSVIPATPVATNLHVPLRCSLDVDASIVRCDKRRNSERSPAFRVTCGVLWIRSRLVELRGSGLCGFYILCVG